MSALTSLLPLLSIIVFLNGPIVLFTAFLEKDFYFKELSIIDMSRQIILFISTYVFLFGGLGLRGVVIGQIVAITLKFILVLLVSYKKDYIHFNIHFNVHEIKPYIKFGLFIGGKQLMTQLTHHVDELIIGYFLSAEVLGLYFFAKNLLNRLRALITTAFSKVLLPLLSKVKNDLERLTRTYNAISRYVGVFAFPVFIGIALTADSFIPVLFGEEWLPSVEFFIILSIAYIPEMLTANLATSLLYSVNKPNLVLYLDIIANGIYIALLLLFSWLGLGIYTIVGLYAIYLIGKTTASQYLTQQHLHSTFKEYLGLFKYSLLATLVMGATVLALRYILLDLNSLLFKLIIYIVAGVTSYIITYVLIDKKTLKEIINLVTRK